MCTLLGMTHIHDTPPHMHPTAARSLRPHCVRTAFARVFRTRQKMPFGGLRASMHDLYLSVCDLDHRTLLDSERKLACMPYIGTLLGAQ